MKFCTYKLIADQFNNDKSFQNELNELVENNNITMNDMKRMNKDLKDKVQKLANELKNEYLNLEKLQHEVWDTKISTYCTEHLEKQGIDKVEISKANEVLKLVVYDEVFDYCLNYTIIKYIANNKGRKLVTDAIGKVQIKYPEKPKLQSNQKNLAIGNVVPRYNQKLIYGYLNDNRAMQLNLFHTEEYNDKKRKKQQLQNQLKQANKEFNNNINIINNDIKQNNEISNNNINNINNINNEIKHNNNASNNNINDINNEIKQNDNIINTNEIQDDINNDNIINTNTNDNNIINTNINNEANNINIINGNNILDDPRNYYEAYDENAFGNEANNTNILYDYRNYEFEDDYEDNIENYNFDSEDEKDDEK